MAWTPSAVAMWLLPVPGPLISTTLSAPSMKLTARGYHRMLKVARALADLDAEANLARLHLAEALSYRSRVVDSI